MRPSTKLERLRDLKTLPTALRWSAGFYLLHILVQGKVAPLEITAFFASLFLGWALWKRQAHLSFHILYFPLALYGLASSISSIVAPMRLHAFGESMLWIKMSIFPTALILFRTIRGLRELAFRTQVVFAVIIALYGLAQFFLLDRRDLEHRITGPSPHVMTYSGLLLPMALLLLVVAAHRRNVWLAIATVIVSLALLLTFTRSVWLGWAVAVFVLMVLKRARWLPAAAGALLLFVSFMPMDLFGRLASTFDMEQRSNLDRVQMVRAGTEIIRDYPILGVGPANVKEIYPLYRDPDALRFRPPHLHNNVVQIWAERGIVALLAYVLLIVLFLRECARGWNGPARDFAQGGVALAIGLTYAGFFEFNFGDTEVFYLMLELFALVIATLESAQPASNEPRPTVVAAGPAPEPVRP